MASESPVPLLSLSPFNWEMGMMAREVLRVDHLHTLECPFAKNIVWKRESDFESEQIKCKEIVSFKIRDCGQIQAPLLRSNLNVPRPGRS